MFLGHHCSWVTKLHFVPHQHCRLSEFQGCHAGVRETATRCNGGCREVVHHWLGVCGHGMLPTSVLVHSDGTVDSSRWLVHNMHMTVLYILRIYIPALSARLGIRWFTWAHVWCMQLDKAGKIGDIAYPAGQRIMGSAVNAMATKVRATSQTILSIHCWCRWPGQDNRPPSLTFFKMT
jgi:hypothetical protein